MNTRKLFAGLFAAGAAAMVALMVWNVIGGGSKHADAKTAPPPAEISEVLVAATRIDPGKPLTADQVRWQPWPAKIIDPSFIRRSSGQSLQAVVEGTVARAPMVEGEPISFTKIVRSQGAGFMAATIAPGMRAVAISVSVASVAGGFIFPNNRVDILLTTVSGDPKQGTTRVVLSNVRVVAIDQAFDDKNQKAVSDVKTVTLELTPAQARTVNMAQVMGTLSLALRSLGDEAAVAANAKPASAQKKEDEESGMVTVLRYGLARKGGGGGVQ